ncbi:hypothetical protein DSO57_1032507 [Entomophthora muscae]|uniref:Uncharacterized protein n=1 Tax=Entomophthora muscae TaxID=34485 RepID=A0ACC2TME2_9FUNG|nr:hypothetical protein DSO57_1032507 [Entomophthora muscae]
MKAPLTPKADHLQPTPGLTPPTANQYAGVAYIILAELVNTMVPAAVPWALVGQSASYLIKLAPLLWWTLPSSQQSKLASEASRPSPGTQYPDKNHLEIKHRIKSLKADHTTHLVIDNSLSLETWTQEQESNPDPRPPWSAGPVDQRTARPRFAGIKPLQADTKNVGPCSEIGQNKEIIASNGRLITAPIRGIEAATISFMNLKSAPVANQEPSPERGMGPQPNPMTLKKVNQVANLRFLTNERTPGPSVILLPLDSNTQFPQACLYQCPDEPPHGKY